MSDEINDFTEEIDEHLKEINELYENVTLKERFRILVEGMKAPRDSKEYKAAMIELQRLSAPAAAVFIPIVAVLLLIVMSAQKPTQDRVIETQVIEAEELKDLDEIEEIEPPEEQMQEVDVDIPIDSPNVQVDTPAPNQPMSPQPQAFDAVMTVKSPVILKNIYGSTRNTGTRGAQLARFGGDKMTEAAVMRALRWLKKNQHSDGSWGQNRTAMAGLGILTFLAHGEKPGDSVEFGPTVQKALQYLIDHQKSDGRFSPNDVHEYGHPIAAYALCEAYGMTLNPNVKSAALMAMEPIIKGQHPTGGWTYNMSPAPWPGHGYRDDTSYMGWCAQALKACHLAKLEVEGLERATKLAIKGFKKNAHPNGGFGYCDNRPNGLTSVGTLSMLLLGAGGDSAVKNGQSQIEKWEPLFLSGKMGQGERNNLINALPNDAPKVYYKRNPQYYLYYATQCKFHEGGQHWSRWNRAMKKPYVQAQIIEKNAIKDPKGKLRDIGHWVNSDTNTDRPVMDTCLAALQLMVYYRYLPTTKASAVKVEEEIAETTTTDTEDITVDVGDL